jgi:hypothetical protein
MTCYTFKERLCLQIYVTAIASKKHLKKSIYVINQMALNFSRSVHIWILPQAICKKQELLTHHDHLSSSPVFGAVRVAHLLSFLCCGFLVFFVCSVCLRPVVCVSGLSILDWPLRVYLTFKVDILFIFVYCCTYDI